MGNNVKFDLFAAIIAPCCLVLAPAAGPGAIAAADEIPFYYSTVTAEGGQGTAAGDIDGDGYPDVVLAEGEFDSVFLWYRYPDWASFTVNTPVLSPLDYVPNLAVSDIDRDGDLDIVCPNSHNSGNKEVWWLENPGNPAAAEFSKHTVYNAPDAHIKEVEVADFDRDGKPDIAIRIGYSVCIFHQKGPDDWQRIEILGMTGYEGLGAGDVDGDGYPDLVLNGYLLINPGTRSADWDRSSFAVWSETARAVVADIDGDGRGDPVISNSEGTGLPVAWYSSSDPANGPWTQHILGWIDTCHTLQAGDIDRDGDIDVYGASLYSAKQAVYLNDGVGNAFTEQIVDDTRTGYIGKLADIGADGDLDIVSSRSFTGGPIDLWENRLPPAPSAESGDFDGDGTDEIALFRPSSGLWSARGLTRFYFGSSNDRPVPADYDGDGTADPAVFRGARGLWSVRGLTRLYLGSSADSPVPGDYNGDGRAEAASFRGGFWAIWGLTRIFLGASGDRPAPGDYDGDGTKEAAVFRPSSGLWSVAVISRFYFGGSDGMPIPGDYTGDPLWEAAIFRPDDGLWAVRSVTRMYLGTGDDLPLPADYDGDGRDGAGIFRAATGMWSIRNLTRAYFGTAEDRPATR